MSYVGMILRTYLVMMYRCLKNLLVILTLLLCIKLLVYNHPRNLVRMRLNYLLKSRMLLFLLMIRLYFMLMFGVLLNI